MGALIKKIQGLGKAISERLGTDIEDDVDLSNYESNPEILKTLKEASKECEIMEKETDWPIQPTVTRTRKAAKPDTESDIKLKNISQKRAMDREER